jgi:folate-binding protein YgfZ
MSAPPIAAPSAAEMSALRNGIALAPLERDRVDLLGPDRARFLHNLVTCEVRELAADRAVRGFLTHVKGGVLADVDVVALGDCFRLVLPAGRGGAIRSHLEKHRLVERVEVEERPELAALALRGARAPELLGRLGVGPLEPGERRRLDALGAALAVRRERRGGEPRYELEAPVAAIAETAAELWRAADPAAPTEVSPAAVELARIEDGELAWGVDYGEENFPQETGEDDAVSYTKGCYLGQEVVARIHYRGGVQRRPCRLRFDEGAEAAAGDELLHDGRPVGRATSIAREPIAGRTLALALVHRRAAAAGTRLATVRGAGVEVLGPG